LKERNNSILADTSVWIEFFKPQSTVGKKLETLIMNNSVWVCGVVLFELVQGVRSEEEKAKILDALSDLEYAEMTRHLWRKTAELSASLKKKGLNLPLSDILITALAIEHNLKIFTLDKHFAQIPGVKLYQL
jgi:hypothetical protein